MQDGKRGATTNHDTGLTGIIAVVCMLVDHMGVVFFPGHQWMRVVGRIAFPLFAWGVAIGAEHTRDIGKYAMRMLLMAVISQPFFMGGLNHSLTEFNIFATLFLGLVAIWGLKEHKEWMTVIALLLANVLTMDYGIRGVFFILLLWATRNNPLALAGCVAAYCVTVWGYGSTVWRTELFDVKLQTTAMLALPLMLWPRSKRTRTPRWLMYAVYPGHLAVIWIIREIMGR